MNNSYEKIMFNNQVSTAVTNYLILQERLNNILNNQDSSTATPFVFEIAILADKEVKRLEDTKNQANYYALPEGYHDIVGRLRSFKKECDRYVEKNLDEMRK